jgi:peptidyl-prolyl cis-trans isomerase C
MILPDFRVAKAARLGECPPPKLSQGYEGFSMTTSFSVTKTGLAAAMAGCIAAVLLTGPVRAEDKVLAKVNGSEIRQSDVALAEEELGPSLAQMDPSTKDENVLAFLIDMKVVAKAAEDKKIADTDDFKKRLAFTRSRLLMDNLLGQEGKAATTDDAMKKVYEDAAKQISGEQEIHARHILVETEDEAKAVKAELDKGADFAELAKKKSKDPGASDGGDLGFFTKDQMVPEFSDAAFKLQPGQISDPVKSQFGWHVIKVEEKRNRKPPEFDQVKGQIETYVTRKAQADYVAKLRDGAKIERMDQTANTPATPATAPADVAKDSKMAPPAKK